MPLLYLLSPPDLAVTASSIVSSALPRGDSFAFLRTAFHSRDATARFDTPRASAAGASFDDPALCTSSLNLRLTLFTPKIAAMPAPLGATGASGVGARSGMTPTPPTMPASAARRWAAFAARLAFRRFIRRSCSSVVANMPAVTRAAPAAALAPTVSF